MQTLEEQIKKLTPEQRKEVRRLVASLLKKKSHRKPKKLSLSWRGGLRELRDKYTSVELQHKALEWWGD